ncbi:MAG TPA: hypothetical protein HA224_04910 [Nanoarchaeota archaeon]|nr:hypothetical protein [Nanoarchaeota archaeon]
MAIKFGYNRLSAILIMLIFVAGSLFFYAENPNLFQLSFHKAGSGEVSLIVTEPQNNQANELESNNAKNTGARG